MTVGRELAGGSRPRAVPASGGLKDGAYPTVVVALAVTGVVVVAAGGSLFSQLLAVRFLVLALFGLSVGLVWGYGGVWMFGQSAFFGGGAYSYALYSQHTGSGGILALVVGLAVPVAFALLLSATVLARLHGMYFALVSIVLVFVTQQAAQTFKFAGGFNGVTGVAALKIDAGPLRLDTSDARSMVFAVGSLLLVSYLCLAVLVTSQWGAALTVVRDDPELAASMGYSPAYYRTIALSLSAIVAALAGVLFAATEGAVFPNTIGFTMSAQAVVWLLVGGQASLAGPLIASLFLSYTQDSLSSSSVQERWVLIQGALLVTIALWLPNGLLDLVPRLTGTLGFHRKSTFRAEVDVLE